MRRKILTALMAVVMMATSVMPAFAQTHQKIRLPKNQVWMYAGDISRTGSYSYVVASCEAVYPIKGADTFKKVQVRVKDTKGHVITAREKTVLTEGKKETKLKLREGYYAAKIVKFQFRGNTKKEAYAIVNYNAR